MKTRPFTKTDWYGFAGAECGADGAEPHLADGAVDGVDALFVIDNGGIGVYVGEDGGYFLKFVTGLGAALAFAEYVFPADGRVTKAWLTAAGFTYMGEA